MPKLIKKDKKMKQVNFDDICDKNVKEKSKLVPSFSIKDIKLPPAKLKNQKLLRSQFENDKFYDSEKGNHYFDNLSSIPGKPKFKSSDVFK